MHLILLHHYHMHLQKNDILYIPSITDLKEEETVAIYGEVANPGTFLFSKNMTIEDLLVQAGGYVSCITE